MFFGGCEKHSNQKLAQTYFRMAFNELADDPDDLLACKRALVNIDRALDQEPQSHYYAFKATVLFKLGDYSNSDVFFKKALSTTADDVLRAEITNNYACLLARKGDSSKALDMWQRLIHDPNYQTPEVAWVNLGKLYVASHDLPHAQDAFKQAVLTDPSYLDAHYYLGLIAQQQGDRSTAVREIKLVLALEPDHVGANALAHSVGLSTTDVAAEVNEG